MAWEKEKGKRRGHGKRGSQFKEAKPKQRDRQAGQRDGGGGGMAKPNSLAEHRQSRAKIKYKFKKKETKRNETDQIGRMMCFNGQYEKMQFAICRTHKKPGKSIRPFCIKGRLTKPFSY